MKTQLFFTLLLLLGITGASQKLTGADRALLGTLVLFEIVPAQEASWHTMSSSSDAGTYQVDTSLSKLYFASPQCGRSTIIARIVTEGKPRLFTKTFYNGEDDRLPPTPPVSSPELWIISQTPDLVKSKNVVVESGLVAACFEEIIRRIDDGKIKTVQNAQAQLQITLTEKLALASLTAVTDWMPFLTELSHRLEQEFGDKIDDLTEVQKIFQQVHDALKSLEMPKRVSALKREIDQSKVRIPRLRPIRNLLSN